MSSCRGNKEARVAMNGIHWIFLNLNFRFSESWRNFGVDVMYFVIGEFGTEAWISNVGTTIFLEENGIKDNYFFALIQRSLL